MLEQTGIPDRDNIQRNLPDQERLEEGPVAIFECFQEIPCDPCYYSCPLNAIEEFEDINDLPEVDYDACSGCAQCVSNCPGLAIFVLDYNYSEKRGVIRLPYEYTPLPEVGETVKAMDRSGAEVAEGEIVKVVNQPAQDKTAVVWLAVDKDLLLSVRHFKRMEE
ncbi:MAG: 4Fe-4S binding protein [Bacillota bacterium]